jgi:hypothetical protein
MCGDKPYLPPYVFPAWNLKGRGYSVGRPPLGGGQKKSNVQMYLTGRLEKNVSATGSCQINGL